MVTYVLDASAVLRFLDKEAGQERVSEIIQHHLVGTGRAIISAVHWGEIIGIFFKRHGIKDAGEAITRLLAYSLVVIPVTAERAQESALIKSKYRIPYVDAFAVELTRDSPEHVLITADFDMQPAESLIAIEILPPKLK